MQLPILSEADLNAWYKDGLSFTCTQCGNCCTGPEGYVWLTGEEVERLATFLKKTPEQVVKQYCRRIGNRLSLKERKNLKGDFDCVFLTPDGPKRGCTIYPVRPLQCRTWPFWDGNLRSAAAWERATERCPGINKGRSFALPQIVAIRDAEDWPPDAPSSTPPGAGG